MIDAILQVTTPLLTSNIVNATSPTALLTALNQSPVFGGYLGLWISLAFFVLFTVAFSFRIKIVHALLASSMIALLISIITLWIGIGAFGTIMIFIGICIIATILTVTEGILRPFD